MPNTGTISSAGNPLLKEVRRAARQGGLTADGCLVADTFHLLQEALRSPCEVKVVFATQAARALVERLPLGAARVVILGDKLLQSISSAATAQGVVALVKPRAWNMDELFEGVPLLAVLDGLQDPGNAGAIARTAEAFGATGMLLLGGTASPHNPKTLRASAGSLFRLPWVAGITAAEARAQMERRHLALYAAAPAREAEPGRSPAQADFSRPCALIVGSEAHGVSAELRASATHVAIPTVAVESLNAAVAAGILLYEAHRQRTARP
jgi:TrmH family RNA methyltransferase